MGTALTVLNLPLEYFIRSFEMPWVNLFNDINQWLFYANLLVFWLIFAGGHLIGDINVGESESEGLIGCWRNQELGLGSVLVCLPVRVRHVQDGGPVAEPLLLHLSLGLRHQPGLGLQQHMLRLGL